MLLPYLKTSKLVCHRKSRRSCHDEAILLNVETVAPMLNAHISRLIKGICFLGQRQKTIYHSCISALYINSGLLSWLSGKEFTCQARDTGLIPGLRRSSEEGNGKPLQYSCLENPMYRRTWKASVHGVSKSQTVLCE